MKTFLLVLVLIGVGAIAYSLGYTNGLLSLSLDTNRLQPKALPPPSGCAFISVGAPGASIALEHGYVSGGPEFEEAIYKKRFPPRCRNVPEGYGCFDWLEPGEKNWDTVFATRPKAHAD